MDFEAEADWESPFELSMRCHLATIVVLAEKFLSFGKSSLNGLHFVPDELYRRLEVLQHHLYNKSIELPI